MAYVILTANGEEFDRRELIGPAVLGRAPDCAISVPDIMLSRHHCRLEQCEHGQSWRIVDLHSKNGTHIRGKMITTQTLHNGDELRIGRTRLTFCAGEFVPSERVRSRGVIRPADPDEALAGTITGMVLCEPGEVDRCEGMPFPQPRPVDPDSYVAEDLYGMINEIASSSWDSIVAQNSRPVRMQRAMPVAAVTKVTRGSIRPKARVAFCLQAEHRRDAGGNPRSARAIKPRWWNRRRWLVGSTIGGCAMFVITWMMLIFHGPQTASSGTEVPLPAVVPQQQLVEPVDVEPVGWDSIAEIACDDAPDSDLDIPREDFPLVN